MDLLLFFDHRFGRNDDGVIFSPQNYHYSLFANRYLQVFDRVRILARVEDGMPWDKAVQPTVGDGVEVISVGNWVGPYEFLLKYRAILSQIETNTSQRAAAIMITPGTIGFLGSSQLQREGHPYAVEVVGDPHDTFAPGSINHPLRAFFRWWFSHQMRRQCHGACAAAYVTEHALQKRYPAGKATYTTHYSSIELHDDAFAPNPRPVRRGARTFTLISVGTMARLYKGPDILIEAFGACIQGGTDLELVLIGDGKFRPVLEARVSNLGLSDRVSFLGQLPAGDAVRTQLDGADVFVLPSKTEGLPRAMIEAMARGLPCIGSTAGGIPELLPAEDMVPPGDATALANKIIEVVKDPERMARMSARNLQKARDYHEAILQKRRTAFYRHVRERTEAWLRSIG